MWLSLILLCLSLFCCPCYCKCPRDCTCDFIESHKRVTCESGGMISIPTGSMDPDVHILVVTAPKEQPNDLSLGRFFQSFMELEEVHITLSNIPAIGESSFWPGRRLKILNLSHNNITLLKGTDFHGLDNLQVLNLSNNNIAATPSAPFRFLSNLRVLSLSQNKLKTLVPRFFYMLPQLEYLDLSGNPLQDVDPENLKDLRPLKRLNLSNCKLSRLHSLLYQQLPNLEELDISHNEFTHFAPEEFRHLKKLRILNLHGNRLQVLSEKTFDGHRLDRLDLGKNRLTILPNCAFCNTTVRELDLSGNQLKSLNSDTLSPISQTIKSLDVSYNPMDTSRLGTLIRPLGKLRRLSMSGTGMKGVLPPEMFSNNARLIFLDLSRNMITNVTVETLRPLKELTELNLSFNYLRGMHPLLLDQLSNMTALTTLLLHRNPWVCERCYVEGMLLWMRHNHFYQDACEHPGLDDQCLRCDSPPLFQGRDLVKLSINAIPVCTEPISQSQVLVGNSQVGLAVAVFIIVSVILIILVVIILYRRQGAVYYTHEDDRPDDSFYGSQDLNGGTYKKQPSVYVTTLDRIDEIAEEKPCLYRNSYR